MKKHASDLPVEDPRRVDRVRDRTPAHVLARLDRRTAARVFRVARDGQVAIRRRIDELDREWDIDRILELGFIAVTTVSELRARRSPRWRALFRAQQLFLVLHAAVGWSPPTAILRRLGVRTQKEIDAERAVLTELYHLLREEPEVVELDIAYEAAVDTGPGIPTRW